MATIGINWDAIWKPVWDPVWQTEVVTPPVPEAPVAHGGGMAQKQYRKAPLPTREQAIALDDEELLLILSEAIGVIE
jgi:hypothetical protein